jgi:hypothetical protein
MAAKVVIFIVLSIFIFPKSVWAERGAQCDTVPTAYRALYWGIEQEILPYLLHGYALGGWGGLGRARLRLAAVRVDMPSFMRSPLLSRERINANSICVDFFLKDKFEGFYFGGGGGYWRHRVLPNANLGEEERQFYSLIFSGGCGYNWLIWKGLYISPWVALHTRLTGNNEVTWGNDVKYTPQMLLPEISLKIGWRIGRGQ